MRLATLAARLFLTITLASSAALAQDDPFDAPAGGGDTTSSSEGSPSGAEENPGDPDALTNGSSTMEEDGAGGTAKKDEPVEDQGEYPQRFIDRPLILHEGMAEVRLEAPATFDEPLTGVSLVAVGRFAVIRELEVGLRWSAIAFHESFSTGEPVDGTNTAGKAIQVDVLYTIFPWLAAQVSLPMYLQPFAMGLTLGAPMQGNIGPVRFFFGRDLIQINLKEFVPYYDSPVANEILVLLNETDSVLSDGRVNLLFGAAYQASDKLAIIGESGMVFEDFKNKDTGVPFWVTGQLSPSNKLDVGLRVGSERLDDFTATFGVRLHAALRI